MARLHLDHYCHRYFSGSPCSSYLAPPKKGAMPKSPGYSSITNSFPSTVLPAGFFTTPRRTFRVFLMKKAEGEKIISGTYIATIFKGNISKNSQSFLKDTLLIQRISQKKSFI